MRNFFFLTALVMTMSSAYAEDISFSGQTYFTKDRLDRIYFAADGEFQQQLQDPYGSLPPGTILYGTWVFEDRDRQLCMRYKQFGIGQHCFIIDQGNEAEDTLNEIYASTLADGEKHFIWRYWRDGNWLLSPSGMAAMRLINENKLIKNSIIVDDMMADYLTGKVLEDNMVMTYFEDRQTLLSIDKADQDKNIWRLNWDVSSMRTNLIEPESNQPIDYTVITLGTEFLFEKPRQAYYYLSADQFMVEGEGFTLTPFDEYENKALFSSPVIDNDTRP